MKCVCKTQMMPPPDHQNPVDMHTSIMCLFRGLIMQCVENQNNCLLIFDCHDFLFPRDEESRGILIYLLFVRPEIDTWFVRLSPPKVLELQL
jgi:hypothetical protein